MENHTHDQDGNVVLLDNHQAEAEAEVISADLLTSAEVEIAKIQAEKEITLARIAAKTDESYFQSEIEALKAEIVGMREALALTTPEPVQEPAPEQAPVIVVNDNDNESDDETIQPAPEPEPAPRKKSRGGIGVWGR
jgi:hypothetical protein